MATTVSASLFHHFANLTDPRIDRGKRHQLFDILFISICAVIAGANDFVAIATFGVDKEAWLRRFLELPNGIPCHDTFGRVFAALNPRAFFDCFVEWIRAVAQANGRFVAIDGKTLRASLDRATNLGPLHVVSAWATQQRLSLGQVAVAEKSNEITAIPQLLEMLELEGAIVTIDAMGCQKEIAAKIRERGADYVLTVKANQEHLEQDVAAAFRAADEGSDSAKDLCVREAHDRGHGRTETRRYEVLPVPSDLRGLEQWQDLRSIARVIRVYQEGGQEKSEVRYFISSLSPKVKRLMQAIRSHWGIENNLHWVLDVYFGEDRSRVRERRAAENFAWLRRWTVSLLRQDTTLSGGIEKKRLQAGWNEKKLEKLLGLDG